MVSELHILFQPNAATNTDYVEIKSNGWFNIALTILFDDLSDYRLIKADVFKVMMMIMIMVMIIMMMMVMTSSRCPPRIPQPAAPR